MEEKGNVIPTTVVDIEKSNKQLEKVPWFNYSDQDQFRRRVENFIQETQANLQRNRKTTEFCSDSLPVNNVNRDSQINYSLDPRAITKTHSASNVFYRTLNNGDNVRNANLMHYSNVASDMDLLNRNREREALCSSLQGAVKTKLGEDGLDGVGPKLYGGERATMRRGSSYENVNSGTIDLVNNSMKKIKYGNEVRKRKYIDVQIK